MTKFLRLLARLVWNCSIDLLPLVFCSYHLFPSSRATAALNSSFQPRYITAKSFLFCFIPIPVIFEWIESHFHDASKNFPVPFVLYALDHLVKEPASRDEIWVDCFHSLLALCILTLAPVFKDALTPCIKPFADLLTR